jgi:hypothetical protein
MAYHSRTTKQSFFGSVLNISAILLLAVHVLYGCSSKSGDGNAPVPVPMAPSELTTQTVSTTQITLTWSDNSTDESGFRIQRSSGGDFTDLATVPAGTSSYSDSGLSSSTTYLYRVCAFNASGDSAYSDSVSATTSAPASNVPQHPSALSGQAVSNSQISLSWSDNSSNENGFRILRDAGSGFTTLTQVAVGSTGYIDAGLTPSATYSYRVVAYNDAGDSDSSNTVTITCSVAPSASSITQYGITWTFDKAYETGQFANGDYWVKGPVTITSITNNYHVFGFTPVKGQDGSMINPGITAKQGYDSSLTSYDAALNVSYPNNQPISSSNPLILGVNQTLVSAVSWLYTSATSTEPGCPSFNGGTHTPRPVLRAAAVLTCLSGAAADGSFRPPYAGTDKTIRFNVNQLQKGLLGNLSVTGLSSIPDVTTMENKFRRPWIDHVNEYMGSYVHPSENIPVSFGYGQYMSMLIGDASLLLNLDFSQLPGSPSKDTLLTFLVQLGIDLAGIADSGGYWPPNGGHNMGRKWPILFAGIMLNNDHMKNVGVWTTLFQEDAQTFYVTADDVTRTHSSQWAPDTRGGTPVPYETADIGLPEWGIRHAVSPYLDNKLWNTAYRDINGTANAGFVLSALIMGQRTAWNHDALFDYEDRWWGITGGDQNAQHVDAFTKSMWNRYRTNYGPVWTN